MPSTSQVDQGDPGKVALAAGVALSAADTTLDRSPNGTAVRAAAWLTPAMVATVTSARPAGAPGAQWDLWASHHAYLVPTAVPAPDAGAPPDSAAIAYRQIGVTTTAVGRDGWKDQPRRQILFLTLNRTLAGWRVAAVQTSG